MRAFAGLVIAVAAVTTACASVATQNPEDAVRVISQLEDEWIHVDMRRDTAGFNRLLAPGFTYTENDALYTRAAFLTAMTTGSDTVAGGRNDDLKVSVSGNTAIATGWLTLTGRGARGPFEQHYRFTDTWQFLDGRWQVLAAQDFLKP